MDRVEQLIQRIQVQNTQNSEKQQLGGKPVMHLYYMTTVPPKTPSSMERAASFVARTVTGFGGALLPMLAQSAYKAGMNGECPNMSDVGVREAVVVSAGLALAAAAVTNSAREAATRGLQFGALVKGTTMLACASEGNLLDSLDGMRNEGIRIAGKKYENVSTEISDAVTGVGIAVTTQRDAIGDWFAQKGTNVQESFCETVDGYADFSFCAKEVKAESEGSQETVVDPAEQLGGVIKEDAPNKNAAFLESENNGQKPAPGDVEENEPGDHFSEQDVYACWETKAATRQAGISNFFIQCDTLPVDKDGEIVLPDGAVKVPVAVLETKWERSFDSKPQSFVGSASCDRTHEMPSGPMAMATPSEK